MNNFSLEWQSQAQPVWVDAVGDVRPVINSTADRLLPAPDVTYGIGALTDGGAERAGEGMLLRGWVGLTPPTPSAGLDLAYYPPGRSISTPFCIGWRGAPSAQGWFSAGAGLTLRELYETLLAEAREHYGEAAVVLVELIGLLPVEHIYDRAVKRPINQGDVRITAPEHQNAYFNAGMIRQDLTSRQRSAADLLPLAVVGIGYAPGAPHEALAHLEQIAFYTPPTLDQEAQPQGAASNGIKTHSHAMGWRDAAELTRLLLGLHSSTQASDNLNECLDLLLSSSRPDYVAHLDEWSRVRQGYLRVFLTSPERVRFTA